MCVDGHEFGLTQPKLNDVLSTRTAPRYLKGITMPASSLCNATVINTCAAMLSTPMASARPQSMSAMGDQSPHDNMPITGTAKR